MTFFLLKGKEIPLKQNENIIILKKTHDIYQSVTQSEGCRSIKVCLSLKVIHSHSFLNF